MWTPTIYTGMSVVAVLILCLLRHCRVTVDRWLVMAVAGICLSFGHFGFVMLIQTATGALANVDSAVGGPYWLLYNAMPGYDSFRYPAKWLPIFALGLSIAVAQVFDRYDWRPIPLRWFAITAIAFLFAIGVVGLLRQNPAWITSNAEQHQDEFWGPLYLDGGLAQIQWSIVHSAVAILSILAVTRLPISIANRLLFLVLIIGIDLGIANYNLVATIPVDRSQL